MEWAELVMMHLLLHGNAYLQHIYGGGGQLVALYPVHPQCVDTQWDSSRPGGKLYKVHLYDGASIARTVEFDASDMTQVMGPSLDGLVGLSVLHSGRLSLGTAIAGEKAANRTYRNGAMISGLVTPSDPEDELTPDQATAVKDMVNQVIAGPERAGDVVVMSQALKFTPWMLSPQDAQFMESRTFSVDEIGRWFGVPPHLLGLTEKSTSWGQGIAEQNRGLARYTLTPWTSRLEQRLSTLLPRTRKAEFDYTAFVRPAPEDEIALLIQEVNSGLLTLNEARAIRNLPPVPGGDTIRTPAGAAPPTASAGPQSGQEAP
jgi:HK97 family phage portal protein